MTNVDLNADVGESFGRWTLGDVPRGGRVDPLCVQGDTPGAARFAVAVRTAMPEAGLVVRPFVNSEGDA